jgi:hypothetical protein
VTALSRRTFAESLALAALAPVLGVSPERIGTLKWRGDQAELAPPGALAKALTQAIRAQYRSRLSAQDLATISQQIQSGLERLEKLRKVSLANGDEPDFVFTAAPLGDRTR